MNKKMAILFGSVVLMASALCGCGSSNREHDAWVCAQNIVKEELKSPSTADFCSYPDASITNMGNDRYMVEGYVDAENSFGAEIRTDFTVTLTLTKSGYKDESCCFDSDSESDDMEDFISDYIDEHPEEYNQTDESGYDTQHTCEVSGCYKNGIYSMTGFSGDAEYYCSEHYHEMENMVEMMFGD